MYKFLSIILIGILLFFYCPQYTLADIAQEYTGTFYIYTYQNFNTEFVQTTKNGNGYIISTETKNAKELLSLLNKNLIQGMSLAVERSQLNLATFLHKTNSKIIFNENIDELSFIYAYSPIFNEHITYNEQKINLQICKNQNLIHIGVPLILGSM